MNAPSDREPYSTLEVAEHADVLRQGKYPEVVAPSTPEAYGYYEPVKSTPNGQPVVPPTATSHLPSTAQSYSTYPEVADGSGANPQPAGSKGAKICGIPRKYFWIAVAAAVLIIIAVVVGAVVGSMNGSSAASADNNDNADNNNNNNSGNGGGEAGGIANNGTGSAKLTLFEDTRLASANFTDASGNENFILAYQMSDASICMSTFNSLNGKWVVSTIVNGTTEGIKLGTSLSINTFWQGSNSPDVNLYYQGNGSSATIKAMTYSTKDEFSTTQETLPSQWKPVDAASGFNSLPGSSLVSYGKQCALCNQYGYVFWEGQQGLFIVENTGGGIKNAELLEIAVEPSVNTSIAITYSGTQSGDRDAIRRRSLDLFYRSKTSGLTQLRIGNGMNVPLYVGRDIGPRTNFAAFSTGFNESKPADNPTPLGFQVLSVDPDAGDGVQLTYLKDGEWNTATDEVADLAGCADRATIDVHTGRRLYCLVGSGDDDDDAGVKIVEWAWQGDPSDPSSYLDWRKLGAVNVGI